MYSRAFLSASIFFFFAALQLHAESVPVENPHERKEVWTWTLEERLAQRFDATAINNRKMSAASATKVTGLPLSENADVILGDVHPELLLPWELFRNLVRSVFSSDLAAQTLFREKMADRATHLKADALFWSALQNISRELLELQDREQEIIDLLGTSGGVTRRERLTELEQLQRELCYERAQALENARKHFGPEAFDRFLYEAVAPGMFLASVLPSIRLESLEQMRFMARGCTQ